MVPRRRPALSTVTAAVAVAVLVAFSAVAYMVIFSPSTSSSTTGLSIKTSSSALALSSSSQSAETRQAEPGSAVETTNSSLGLKLVLSVNATTIPSQDAISINASVMNTLPTANNLTASNDWAVQGLRAGPCDSGNSTNKLFSPVGLGIYRGTYGLNNVSSAGGLREA